MHVGARSFVTAGVAAVAASAVALTPAVVPKPPDITVPAVHLSAAQVTPPTGADIAAAINQFASTAAAAAPSSAAQTTSPGDAIIAVWQAAVPIITSGVALTEFGLSFLPGLALIGCQIGDEAGRCPGSNFSLTAPSSPWFYGNVVLPVANAVVEDLIAPVVDNPLDLTSYINGITAVGSALTTGLATFANGELQYLFGTLFPPIPLLTTVPPLPPFVPPTDSAATAQVTSTPLAASPLSAAVKPAATAPSNSTSAGTGTPKDATNTAGVADPPVTASKTAGVNTGTLKSLVVTPGSVGRTSTDRAPGALSTGKTDATGNLAKGLGDLGKATSGVAKGTNDAGSAVPKVDTVKKNKKN
jgi:hypothetical protein